MKYLLQMPLVLFVSLVTLSATAQEVKWLSIEEAYAKSQTDTTPKKIFIDVYTDWCGWCKKMDKDTFQNEAVAAYMNEKYYMVKLDAEGKDPITFKDTEFKFISSGRNGYHELAAALLQGKMSYPTVVFLDESFNMLSPVPGYQKPDPFMNIAKYFGENIYKTSDWKTYSEQGK